MASASAIVTEIFHVFRRRGHRQYGERVTEEQHALQCATLAGDAGESPTIIAACLLHDFGHLLHDLGEDSVERGIDSRHEEIGALRLAPAFGPTVVEPIRLHSDAKRYLCWKESGYFRSLSDSSRRSLVLRGGPMSDSEAFEFEVHPHFEPAVRVRRYDDLAKVPGVVTPGLETFRAMLETLVRQGPGSSDRGIPSPTGRAYEPPKRVCAPSIRATL